MLNFILLDISHSSWGFSLFYLNTAFPKHFTAIKNKGFYKYLKVYCYKTGKYVFNTPLQCLEKILLQQFTKTEVRNYFYGKAIVVPITMQ